LKNGFLGPQNTTISFEHMEKSFFLTLNVTILQMVRNECARYGGYVDLQVSYKDLTVRGTKEGMILHNLPYFEKVVVLRPFWTQRGH
jgi:hypothetical protein